MKTISFYSYKGGTGRTLLLANIASVLANCGKKVVVLDLDLEAPGLHYKFHTESRIQSGFLDFLLARQGSQDTALQVTLDQISLPLRSDGLDLVPAGSAPSLGYASKLGQLNWRRLFEVTDAARPGAVRVIEDLKTWCEERGTDYLLVDSRTGLTDVGTLVLHLLSDVVVCLMVYNPENLDGLREVLRSVATGNRDFPRQHVDCLVGISRIEEDPRLHLAHEDYIRSQTLQHLTQPPKDDREGPKLDPDDIVVLHSDRQLELEESLLVTGNRSPNDSPLLRDYYEVFRRLDLDSELEKSHQGNRIVQLLASTSHEYGQPSGSVTRSEGTIKQLVARGKVLEVPGDEKRATVRARARARGRLEWVSAYFHESINEFVRSVGERIAADLSTASAPVFFSTESSTPLWDKPEGAFWSALTAIRILEGQFDFCGEPYYLTWSRSHLAEIVQIGWVRAFTIVAPKKFSNELDDLLSGGETIGKVLALLASSKKFAEAQLAVLGETAAASEYVRYLSTAPDDAPERRFEFKTQFSEKELGDFLTEAAQPSRRPSLVLTDIVVARRISAQLGQRADEVGRGAVHYYDPVGQHSEDGNHLKILFENPVPVGFPYPAGDRDWRQVLSGAVRSQIKSQEDQDYRDLATSLQSEGIELFERQELLGSLSLDQPAREIWQKIDRRSQTTDAETGNLEGS